MSEFSKPVLALDSSMGGCVAAVMLSDGRSFSKSMQTDREQAAKLIPMVQAVMDEAGAAFADLGLIVTTVGPGSFTGLRISLSAARAMGLALGIPVQGVSTFEAVARSAVPEEAACMVVLESKRADFYVQAFDASKNPVGEAACLLLEEIDAKGAILCGDGLARLGKTGREVLLPDPIVLAKTGLARFLENGGKAEKPEPVYLRSADVSVSNKVQREISNFQH